MATRRDALRTIAAAAAVLPVLPAQDHQHGDAPAEPVQRVIPKEIAPADFAMLSRVMELIIPGSLAAGVPYLVPRIPTALQEAFAQLRSAGFLDKPETGQIAALTEMSQQQPSAFQLVKDMTIDGYYSTKEGLVGELGWHGNTYLAAFPGCTHKEHQL